MIRIAALVVALAACKGHDAAPEPKPGSAATPAGPALDAWLGHAIAPPAAFAKLRIGMTRDEANAALPGITQPSGVTSELAKVHLGVELDPEHGTLMTFDVFFPAEAGPSIDRTWGKGVSAQTPYDQPATYWFDPVTGWRAARTEGQLAFSTYAPAAALLGDGPEIAALPRPVLGATIAQLRAAYGKQLVEVPGEHAIELPPTEWGIVPTTVTWFPIDGPITRVMLSLPYRDLPDAKSALRGLFAKKWGAATGEGKTLVFDAAGQRVTATDDSINGMYSIAIERHS